MVKAHHWSSDRFARKMFIVDFIEKNIKTFPDGIPERILIKTMIRSLKTAPNTIRTYLDELVNDDGLIEKVDDKYCPVNI